MLYHEKKASKKGFAVISGIDEAGRGPLAGPVVAASVILKTYKFTSKIDDSKRLTQDKRKKAFKEICRNAFIGIAIVDEKTIDIINIYQATRLAMKEAVRSLPVEPDYLLIDGPIKLDLPYKSSSIIDGDRKSLSIAAASIVAKVTRDTLMENFNELFPCYMFRKHKGYGTKLHCELLKKYGPSKIHRMTFRPVRQALVGNNAALRLF